MNKKIETVESVQQKLKRTELLLEINSQVAGLEDLSEILWKEKKDMSGELLSKVKRNNKIVVEFKGTSTISRTD